MGALHLPKDVEDIKDNIMNIDVVDKLLTIGEDEETKEIKKIGKMTMKELVERQGCSY